MTEILFVWLATGILALVWGEMVTVRIGKYTSSEKPLAVWWKFWAGFAFLSFLLCLVGFVTPLTPYVKAVLWTALLSPVFIDFHRFKDLAGDLIRKLGTFGFPSWILVFLCTAIALLKASGRPEIFDEGAYHLPLIRMWENQGLVLGMANLNGHYGLNSSWHSLSAFTNLSFLPFWQTEMSLNGLMSVLLAFYAGSRLKLVLAGSRFVSHWMVVLLPFFVFRNLLSSPSTDIPAIIGTWFILTGWLEILEKKSSPWSIWPVFTIIPFWIVLLKSSSALLLCIPASALFLALQENEPLKIRLVFFSGMVLLLPWAIQNWLLTGYLVFPIRMTALGKPSWQVPIESIDKKFYLAQFGKFAPPAEYNLNWFNEWIHAQNADSRVIILLAFTSLLTWFLLFVFRKNLRVYLNVFLFLTVLACLLGWIITITEPRYGFGSLVFSALFIPSFVCTLVRKKVPAFRFFGLSILLLQGFNFYKTVREAGEFQQFLAFPAPAPEVQFQKLQCGNFEASVPVAYKTEVPDGKPVFCWDCPFPCVPLEGAMDSARIYKRQIGNYSAYEYR